MSQKTDRRGFIQQALAGAVGAAGAHSLEEKTLLAAVEQGARPEPAPSPAEPGALPCGRVGKYSISRLVMGGNLMAGFAHARDLIYVSALFNAYNTEQRIFDTLELAEQHGINTVLVSGPRQDLVHKYRKERGSKIQMILCIKPERDLETSKRALTEVIDKGAELLYTHGEVTDKFIRGGELEPIGQALDFIKQNGLPAGVGSHSLETPIASEQNHLNADFYVKTFHADNYWSATPEESRQEWCWYNGSSSDHDGYHDNMFCLDPERTTQFMSTVAKPWFAFKVMAAGAIHPRMAFPFAYRSGADFIVAGMFDFQVAEDVRIAREALRKLDQRPRPWQA